MHVAAVRFDLQLPQSHSLKDKRTILKPVIEGARRRYSVAVAETGHQDRWQQAEISVAAVSGTPGHVASVLDEVERFVWSFPEIDVLSADRFWLESKWDP